jgi:hypothetical protein
MGTGRLWTRVARRLACELPQPLERGEPLGRSRGGRATWAAHAGEAGSVVIKARSESDRASEKTAWCAVHLPLLARRGYPIPEILWHGALDDE